MANVPLFSEVHIEAGDSVVGSDLITGIRSARHMGVRWLAPLTVQYRVTTTASQCEPHIRRACWASLSSAPFEMVVTTHRGGGSWRRRRSGANVDSALWYARFPSDCCTPSSFASLPSPFDGVDDVP